MKKFIQGAILAVIAMATLALAIPTPVTNACLRCLYRGCPPCTRLGVQTCYKCATCNPIPGCEPR